MKSRAAARVQVHVAAQQRLPDAAQLQRLELDIHPTRGDALAVSSLARYLKEVCMAPVELQTLDNVLRQHDYDAPKAIRAIFGDEIPRVIQGVRK